jgi:predicted O-methyltransferase YrrM
MTSKTIGLDPALYAYLLDHSLREDDLMRRLRAETAALPESRMQIAPEQGQLMALLARLTGARRAIEIGVFTGYSSLCLARALPSDGYLLACDVSEQWTAIARRYWAEAGVDGRIELILAPARDTLRARLAAGEAGTYDLAFIDADKIGYTDYYEACLELLRPGGLILVDNVLWSGRVAEPSDNEDDTLALRAFNRRLHDDERVDLSMLPLADGLTLARKR